MTRLPKDNPFKLLDFLRLNPLQILPNMGTKKSPHYFSKKNTQSVQELMTKFKHIKSGRSGWSNQLCLERKFTLNKSLIWSQLTSPPRKKTEELWSGHSGMKQLLGKQERKTWKQSTWVHRVFSHIFSTLSCTFSILYSYKHTCKCTHTVSKHSGLHRPPWFFQFFLTFENAS